MTAAGRVPERAIRKDVARNQARLLSAADQLIGTHGVGVSLEQIARLAGVGVATAYRHFPDKRALLEAMFQQRLAVIVALLEDADRMDDPVAGLWTFLERLGEMQQDDQGMREIMTADYGIEAMAAMRERLMPLSDHLIERAEATGRLIPGIRSSDIPVMLWMLGAIVEHASIVRPGLWRRYLELLFNGMTQPGLAHAALSVEALDLEQLEQAIANDLKGP